MKTYTQIVIIGAGIVGSSTAYYLARYGCKDVLVIDKGPLFENDGSTSHAPGGVNPLSNNRTMARFAAETIDLVESLPPWKPGRKPCYMVGGVDVVRTAERMYEVKRLYTNAKSFGTEVHLISPQEAEDLFPLLRGDIFVGGHYTPRKPVVAGPHVCG
jgi:glycine/D-amino acid oxidase-like deaminating enzyme